jgi:hypothetical protein
VATDQQIYAVSRIRGFVGSEAENPRKEKSRAFEDRRLVTAHGHVESGSRRKGWCPSHGVDQGGASRKRSQPSDAKKIQLLI